MVNRIWPTAVAGKADSVSSVSASACHIGGPNSVNPGQILLVYGTLHFRISHTYGLIFFEKMVLRFLLIKYVWLIVFTVFSLKYGLLSGYELLGFWAIFMLRRTKMKFTLCSMT